MAGDRFYYVTFIRTTPEALWTALTEREFTEKYWFGAWQDCSWQRGSSWQLKSGDGTLLDAGSVLEADPPRRLVLSWRNQFMPDLHAEGESRATFTIEADGSVVKLTVLHEIDHPESKLIAAVAGGWPMVLSGLKSLLETGAPLDIPRPRPS